MTDTPNPLADANALFGPYDAEGYLTQTLAAAMADAATLLKLTNQLNTHHHPPVVSVQNAITALLADLPRLHLAAERMQLLLPGGQFNPEATGFYSVRTAELADIAARNDHARAKSM